MLLIKNNIKTPITYTCTYNDNIKQAVKKLNMEPYMIKDNQGGSGSGIYRLTKIDSIDEHLEKK